MIQKTKQLIVVGCNHDKTPLHIREKIAISKEQVELLIDQLKTVEEFAESMVLNTCNRLEIYTVSDTEKPQLKIIELLCKLNGFSKEEFQNYSYQKSGIETIHHLFKVSAGLDSQLIGETEIFGQVKGAYALSSSKKSAGKTIHRFLQKAFQAGKWARTHTAIGMGQVSIGNISVELASRIFGRLDHAKMLVIGSGDVGKDVTKAFRSRGIGQIVISSRTIQNAERLANEVSAQVVPYKNWSYELAFSDVVIFATSSPKSILNDKMVADAIKQRKGKPLFVIDLALPRNVETMVNEIDDCYLYNLDDLTTIADENLKNRKAEIERCEKELLQRAQNLFADLDIS